jgi:RimJ/RimL family protein N-acetyltransferase
MRAFDLKDTDASADVPSVPIPIEFATPRLRLRQWRSEDREPFAAMNADPEVMKYFAALGTREGSDRTIDVWHSELEERGWSNWAVEISDSGTFIGFVGLSVPRRTLPFTPCVEIGWRLAKVHWGKGFATEAAKGTLRVAFEKLQLEEVVSFTSLVNKRSHAVMERIGMINSGEDFDHPALPEGSDLRRHCLYRITHERWRRNDA